MSNCSCAVVEYDETVCCDVCTECGCVKSEGTLVNNPFEGYKLHIASNNGDRVLLTKTRGIDLISKLVEKNVLSTDVENEAVECYKQLYNIKEFKRFKEKKKFTCAAYCLFIAARRVHVPITFLLLTNNLKSEMDMLWWGAAKNFIATHLNLHVTDPPLRELVETYCGTCLDMETISLTKGICEIISNECPSSVCNTEGYVIAAAYWAWKAMSPHARFGVKPAVFMRNVFPVTVISKCGLFTKIGNVMELYLKEIPWAIKSKTVRASVHLLCHVKDIVESHKLFKYTKDQKRAKEDYDVVCQKEGKRIKIYEDNLKQRSEHLKKKYDLDSEIIQKDLISDDEMKEYLVLD